MSRNTPKLFLLHLNSRKCLWKSKEDRWRLQCGSHRAAIELPLRMDVQKRNRDRVHDISLEIVPYDLYAFLLSDNACKPWHTNNNFICLRSALNYGCEHQQTAPVTMSRIPSASDAWLKLYLLLRHLPAHGWTWGVTGHLKCSLLSRIWTWQLWWHQLSTVGRQPEHSPQHLRRKIACCFCLPLLSRCLHSILGPGTRRQHFDISQE